MDLRTTYMGIELEHPIVASASPLSSTLDGIRKLEDDGAAAVVMASLFEEQIEHERAVHDEGLSSGTDSFAESLSYLPALGDGGDGPVQYLEVLSRASKAVNIPLIASLNGMNQVGWVKYARELEYAGARAIELNIFYIPADLSTPGRDVEEGYLEIARAVKSVVSIPVAMKLSPFFSSIANMARRLDYAGIDGLVLFNRFFQPDFDIERLKVAPTLSLSTPEDIRLPLLWVAILRGQLGASLAATRGVHSSDEIVKYLLAGADVAMTASALLKHGTGFLRNLKEGLAEWMDRREFESVEKMKGIMSQEKVADPTAYERANYIQILRRYNRQYAP